MCPRRDNSDNSKSSSKRHERETRQQEKKAREKKTYLKNDENAASFNQQLRAFNLQLRDIIGDGNCLFRSFADQLDGDQHRHAFYRERICNFMRENRQDFEPFIVDQPFDAFVSSLSKDGTFGGNECLVAFSRLFDAKICIHQLNQPVWTVCFSNSPKHEIHISYHNFEHYSSVRTLGDHSSTTANIRQTMTTCDPSTLNEKKSKDKNDKSKSGACAMDSNELFTEHDVDYVHSCLPTDIDKQIIRDTLNNNHGDIDGAIDYLLTFDISSTPPITNEQQSNDSIERIMTITGVFDVDLVQQTFAENNLDIEKTIDSLMKLSTDDNETNDDETKKPSTTKTRPTSNRQIRIDKKKAKKQRAVEKHRAQILADKEKTQTKQTEEKSEPPPTNNEEEIGTPANMEFIAI